MTADGNNHHVETRFVIRITRKLVSLWFVDLWLQLQSELHTQNGYYSLTLARLSSPGTPTSTLTATFRTETSD